MGVACTFAASGTQECLKLYVCAGKASPTGRSSQTSVMPTGVWPMTSQTRCGVRRGEGVGRWSEEGDVWGGGGREGDVWGGGGIEGDVWGDGGIEGDVWGGGCIEGDVWGGGGIEGLGRETWRLEEERHRESIGGGGIDIRLWNRKGGES